jgi:hypothetical protein
VKITKITDTDPMRAAMNRGLMVGWINADLIERAGCDVRRSVVLYDEDGLFVHACDAGLSGSAFADRLDRMTEQLFSAGVRFYSVGVK